MKHADDIAAEYLARSQHASSTKDRQRKIRDHYNGDIVVPLPEIDKTEETAVANLLMQGLDQTAMRISSIMPDILVPPVDETSDRSRKYAAIQRKANFGWWQQSTLDLQMAKRARHLIGYSENIVRIRFDPKYGCPVWSTRDPLTSYPSNLRGVDDMTPDNCIFGYERDQAWMARWYPTAAFRFAGGSPNGEYSNDAPIEMVEYVDHDETVLIAMRNPASGASDMGPAIVELERTPNLAGVTPVTVGSRISLDENRGQFDGITGMYQQQAKLMALEVLAVQKGVFPDTWLVGNAGEQPKIITEASGLRGQIGLVRGGQLTEMSLQPGFMTNPAIDRLERGQRVEAGIPAEFGGESTSNIRTGRRGEMVLSAVVDFGVQEAQKILARQLEHENEIAVGQAKAYGGSAKKSFYVTDRKAKGKVDYVPSKHFGTGQNVVSYSQAGADINTLVTGGGQRVQMGTMSKKSFMRLDPMIEDPDVESDSVVAEQLESGLLSGLQQQAASGQLPPADLAAIMALVKNDKADLADAVVQVQKEAQERQAQVVSPTDPAAQPGIAQPGAGAEAMAGGGPPGSEGGGAGLRELLGAL
jgi:hypothetical protein